MKKNFLILLPVILIFLITISCNDDDLSPVDSKFDHGVFIVNEGNFTESDGSLSFYDLDSQKVTRKVFEKINNRPLAGLIQSFTIYEGRGYIIDQQGRVEVVDALDMTSTSSLNTGLSIPRYFAAIGSTGYITDWGPYDENFANPDSRIKVINLGTMSLDTEFETSSRPEDIGVSNGKIFVANSALNLVSVYDPQDNSLITEIETGYGPTRFVQDAAGKLWVNCTGAFITTASMSCIDPVTEEVLVSEDLAQYTLSGSLAINGAGDQIFFMTQEWAPDFSFTETTVFKVSLNISGGAGFAREPERVVSGENWYGIGVDPENDMLYVADAVAFQGNGTVYRYEFDGTPVDSFPSGRGPREFFFILK